MALPGDLEIAVKFDRTTDPASFKIDDDTDYASLSLDTDDVRGVFTIEDPNGNIIHNNTDFDSPDILGSSTLQYSGLAIPLDVNDDIVQGDYLFDYSVVIDDPITALNQGAKTFTVLGNRAAAITSSAVITVVRSTGNNADYDVVSAVFGGVNTVITVTQAIPSATVDGSIQYADQTVYAAAQVTATYEDTFPEIDIDVEVDCFCGTLVSTDATSYGSGAVINSRTHTVVYPAALNIADVVSSNAVVTISPIYTQTWTTIIETDLTYTLDDGSTVDVILTGSKETVVDCDLSLCDISCCLSALNNRYLDNKTANPPLAATYFAALTRAWQLSNMFVTFQKCGQTTAANTALTELRTVANCTEGCSCSGDDDEPQQVIPLCNVGSGTTTVVTAGTGITVTTSVSGTTVTYSVKIADSVMNIINSLSPVNVVGGTGVTVVETTVGGVQTFTVTVDDPWVPLDTAQCKCLLQWSNFAAPTMTITESDQVHEGANMDDINVANATGTVGVGTWKFQNNLFLVDGFQVTPNSTFKPFVSAVLLETQDINGNVVTQANQNTNSAPFDIRILDIGSGAFKFQFVDKITGNPITNYGMVYSYKVMVNILIKE